MAPSRCGRMPSSSVGGGLQGRGAAWLAAAAPLLLMPLRAAAIAVPHPEEYVNVLAGTHGGQKGGTHHSTGNTLPLVAFPWGFNHWSPQSNLDRTSWWFDADADTFRGIRCTHQPSPWIGDYGWFLLRPVFGWNNDEWLGFTSYRAAGALQPWKVDIHSGPRGVQMELVPTKHGATLRVTYQASTDAAHRRICAFIPENAAKEEDEKRAKKTGRPTGRCSGSDGGIDLESRRFSSGVGEGVDLVLHARLESPDGLRTSEDVISPGCFQDDVQWKPMDLPGQGRTQEANAESCQKRCAGVSGCSHFTWWRDGGCHVSGTGSRSEKVVSLVAGPPHCPKATGGTPARQCCFFLDTKMQAEIHIGTSLISKEQARLSIEQEIAQQSFEELETGARTAWHEALMQVEVKDAGPASASTLRRLEMFYTCLYRALLFPRRLEELTPEGWKHWSPYDGQVHLGPGVTDNGFWDTFRTVYPFLSLGYPTQLGKLLEGWINAYRAGGWLPKWASPGYRDSMVGTFADVVIADAILKNISGFDVETAWAALDKDAHQHSSPKDTSRGKFGLQHYIDKGYIPIDVKIGEACSRTLDFAFADAATAAAGWRLGKNEAAQELHDRSVRGLKSLFDQKTGLMGHRKSDGNFKEEPPTTWGDCFTEGSAWHHSFPPFNLQVLAELHGGSDKLLQKLTELFEAPAEFAVGSYKQEIHEMREMRMLGLGQYAHNNQPVHHLPFLFALLGDRNMTSKLVRHILSTAYSPEGFAGDEDNGEMGAWFVLSALGLFATAPGVSEDYVISSMPLFPRVRLAALDLTIEAPQATQESPIIAQVLWNGKPWNEVTISYSMLKRGGVLRYIAPGDAVLGHVVSSLRGALHTAAQLGGSAMREAGRSASVAAKEVANKAQAVRGKLSGKDAAVDAGDAGTSAATTIKPAAVRSWDSDLGDAQLAGSIGYVPPQSTVEPPSSFGMLFIGCFVLAAVFCVGAFRIFGKGDPDERVANKRRSSADRERGSAPKPRRSASGRRGQAAEEMGTRTRRGLPPEY